MNKKQISKILIFSLIFTLPVYLLLSNLLWGNYYREETYPMQVVPMVENNTVYQDTVSVSGSDTFPHKLCARKSVGTGEYQKILYTIQLDSFYQKNELDAIVSNYVSKESCKTVIVDFYLAPQYKFDDYYAWSEHINNYLETTINPNAPCKEDFIVRIAPFEKCKIYGKWDIGYNITVVFYQDKGKCYLCKVYEKSYGEPELFYKTNVNGYVAFKNSEDPDDMYIINGSQLIGYFEGEPVASYPSID